MSPADLASLLGTAKTINYFGMKDAYTARVTDLPSTDTEVTMGGKTKKIHHYGNSGSPEEKALATFEQAIDATVDAKKLSASALGPCGSAWPYPAPAP